MKCSRVMSGCNGEPIGAFRLPDGSIRRMCEPCRATAERMGLAPVRVPEWLARQTAKDTTGLVAA